MKKKMDKNKTRDFKIYLDQNIIQYIYEGKFHLEKMPGVTYIFSNENLKEYSKYKDPRFFDVLRSLKAQKIDIKLDKQFKIKDEATILPYRDPEKIYNARLDLYESKTDVEDLFTSIQSLAYGNRNALDPNETKDQFVNSIMSLLKNLENETETVIPVEIISELNLQVEKFGAAFQESIKSMYDQVKPIEKTRKAFSNKHLSELSIDKGGIIDQISELIGEKVPDKYRNQMFGKEPLEYIQNYTTKYLSVITNYGSLNLVGYKPDSGLTSKNRVESSQYDAIHVANAIFCDLIISGDQRLCDKAVVIYEHLDIRTQVGHIKTSKEVKQQ